MKIVPTVILGIGLLGPIACKSKTTSELKVTEAQKNRLRECVVRTLVEAHPSQTLDFRSVQAFARDFADKAPSQGLTEDDPVFQAYVEKVGCDPTQKVSLDSLGLTIVMDWYRSPLNPANSVSETVEAAQ